MDFAEGYIGRITTMASFAMVYSGAPLFMWIWAVKTAVFIDQIMATYYSTQKVWAAPYELLHGESFPDASIVVPFGCGVLVLLPKADRAKFKSRCALMIFVHYADSHPLYTFAVYSPLTKRVLMRQDCIFLPTLFPMRSARTSAGMNPNGEPLVPMRSPFGIRDGSDPEYSFEGWTESDSLPEYEDHICSGRLTRPRDRELVPEVEGLPRDAMPSYRPFHPAFGEGSAVAVHSPPKMGGLASEPLADANETDLPPGNEDIDENENTEISSSQGSGGGNHNAFLPSPDLPMDGNDAASGPPTHPFGDDTLGTGGLEFMVYLDFPGQDRPRLRYRVYSLMPIRLLYRAIANGILGCEDERIRLFVEDQCLLHNGTISDRFFPDSPEIPTVYLTRNCVVEVRMNVLNINGDGLIPPMAESKGNSEVEPVLNQEFGQIDRVTTGLGDEVIPVESLPLRRVSTRVPVSRSAKTFGGN
jgi:hypothetical protein